MEYSLLDKYNYEDEFYDINVTQINNHNNNPLMLKYKLIKIIFVILILFCIRSAFPLCYIWILFWSKKVETEPNHSHTSALWFILLLVMHHIFVK